MRHRLDEPSDALEVDVPTKAPVKTSRRAIKYGVYAAVIAGLIGGTLAWVNVDKTVTLRVDG